MIIGFMDHERGREAFTRLKWWCNGEGGGRQHRQLTRSAVRRDDRLFQQRRALKQARVKKEGLRPHRSLASKSSLRSLNLTSSLGNRPCSGIRFSCCKDEV